MSEIDYVHRCRLCGEPMPEGEQMFLYHGYSGACPKPPMKNVEAVELDPAGSPKLEPTVLELQAISVLNSIAALPEEVLEKIPMDIRMRVDALLAMATVRRVGVR